MLSVDEEPVEAHLREELDGSGGIEREERRDEPLTRS
jgi:hypothetical protein